MKKILIVLALVLFTVTSNAQRRWSLEGGFGIHTIADDELDLQDEKYNFNGTLRYNVNEKFGIGLYGAYDELDLKNYITKAESQADYWRLNLEGVIDIFEILDLTNKRFTILVHGGPGLTYIKSNNGYENTLPNLSGGFTGLIKVCKRAAIKLDWSTTAHISQGRAFDGLDNINNRGVQSFINNASVGVAFYFGKNNKNNSKEHYDWHVTEPTKDTLYLKPTVIERYIDRTKTIILTDNYIQENVYFKYNESEFNDGTQAFNAIAKIADALVDDKIIYVVGYASPENSTGISDYNMELAGKRADTVVRYLISLGVDRDRIEVNVEGGTDTTDSNNIELNRKVTLFVK